MPDWYLTKDGDKTLLALYERHYSAYQYADGRKRLLFAGPGFKIVLRTDTGDAGFVWRKFVDDCRYERFDQPGELVANDGINNAFFRNEGQTLSSDLIRQADAIADFVWPGERHYTYVDPAKTRRKRDPGRCFIRAGWRKCGVTRSGLIVLERLAFRCA